MTVTALPGWIIDPNNPQGVIRDPNVAATPGGYTPSTQPSSTAVGAQGAPATQSAPIVTPNPSGNLQNTLTTPQAPTTPAPATSNGTTPPQGQTPSGQGLDPASFTNVLEGIKQKFAESNNLIDTKNLLIKGLFTSPLTPDEIAKLPPDVAQVYNSGNKDAIELQLQALNGQIQGGTNTFAQSVNYLVNGYQTSVQQAEQQRKNAMDSVQSFVSAYGSRAGDALNSLYGPAYTDTLKNMGIDLNNFASIPTIAETKANTASTGTAQERADATLAEYDQAFVPGATTADGTPIIDNNGFINPTAWKQAIADLPTGVSRNDFIQRFGNLLYGSKDSDGNYVISSAYGLTPVEMKLITGAL